MSDRFFRKGSSSLTAEVEDLKATFETRDMRYCALKSIKM